MNKAKLSFEYFNDDIDLMHREASKIEFTVPDDMNIWEYKIMCIRLAQSIGYTEKSIKSAFGDINYEHLDNDIMLNLDDIVYE